VHGLFSLWRRDHWFECGAAGISSLTDRFTLPAPFGPLGKLAERSWLNGRMSQLMEYIKGSGISLIDTEIE